MTRLRQWRAFALQTSHESVDWLTLGIAMQEIPCFMLWHAICYIQFGMLNRKLEQIQAHNSFIL
jgi:hypothetical protein